MLATRVRNDPQHSRAREVSAEVVSPADPGQKIAGTPPKTRSGSLVFSCIFGISRVEFVVLRGLIFFGVRTRCSQDRLALERILAAVGIGSNFWDEVGSTYLSLALAVDELALVIIIPKQPLVAV